MTTFSLPAKLPRKMQLVFDPEPEGPDLIVGAWIFVCGFLTGLAATYFSR